MSEPEEIVERHAEPPETAEPKLDSAVIAYAHEAMFVGPLPPPVILKEYERICPGAADRIITLAENQSAHRQGLESQVITSNCKVQDRGPVFGFVLALIVIAIGAVLLWNDKDTAGLVALVSALAAIVVPFIVSKRRQRSELEASRFRDAELGKPERSSKKATAPP